MKSIQSLQREALEAYPCKHRVVLTFDDLVLSLQTNAPEISNGIASYFEPYVSDSKAPATIDIHVLDGAEPDWPKSFTAWSREPGKNKGKEAYFDVEGGRVVRKVRTGMHFMVQPRHHVAIGPASENLNQIINFVNFQFLNHLMDQGYCLCHGAGVAKGGAGIGLSAVSGGGKSTLALFLMNKGCDFVSNDRVLLRASEEGVIMKGIPKQPRVNPGTLLNNPMLTSILSPSRTAELAQMPKAELWELEEKYDVMIKEVYGENRERIAVPLKAYVILNWSPHSNEETQMRRLEAAEVEEYLGPVKKAAGPFFYPENSQPQHGYEEPASAPYLDVLGRVPVYLLSGKTDFRFVDDVFDLLV